MENAEYRLRFADRVQMHLFNAGALTPEAAHARLQSRIEQIDLAIIAESARWGDKWRDQPYTKEDWLDAVSHIVDNFIPRRTQIVIDQFKQARLTGAQILAPLYPDVATPVFNQTGGRAPFGFQLSMDALGDVYFTSDGSDPRQNQPTIAYTPLVTDVAPARVLVPQDDSLGRDWIAPNFDDTQWIRGFTGVGYQQNDVVEAWINLDVEQEMFVKNTTAYIRVPFHVDDPDMFDSLKRDILFDDGFVAYLNGVEVARRNAPASVSWDSAATFSILAAPEQREFEAINLTEYVKLLEPGENLLAVQGLNRNRAGKDFVIVPKLNGRVVQDLGLSSTAMRYTAPIRLVRDTNVKARVLHHGQWSALNQAHFTIENAPLPILGDMDFNGEIDMNDIDDFVLGLESPNAYVEQFFEPATTNGDMDGDGDLDFDDISGFVSLLA